MPRFLFSFLVSALIANGLRAQTTGTTVPVGVVTKSIPAASDATYAPALQRPAVFAGTISSLPTGSSLQAADSPGWTTGQFASVAYYVQITSGYRSGLVAQITGNTTDTLSLAFATQNLGNTTGDEVMAGDSFAIIPYWTLGTLLPEASVPDGTAVFLYDRTQAGVNLSASTIYTMFTGYGWYAGPTAGNDQIIDPDESIVIRAPATQAVRLRQSGIVQMAPVRTTLQNVQANTDQDIRVTSGLPIPVGLGSLLNLGAPETGDVALIFDDTATGINKSATYMATYYDGYGWYSGPTDMSSYQLLPGQGFVYRKLGANSANTLVVTYKPAYQP